MNPHLHLVVSSLACGVVWLVFGPTYKSVRWKIFSIWATVCCILYFGDQLQLQPFFPSNLWELLGWILNTFRIGLGTCLLFAPAHQPWIALGIAAAFFLVGSAKAVVRYFRSTDSVTEAHPLEQDKLRKVDLGQSETQFGSEQDNAHPPAALDLDSSNDDWFSLRQLFFVLSLFSLAVGNLAAMQRMRFQVLAERRTDNESRQVQQTFGNLNGLEFVESKLRSQTKIQNNILTHQVRGHMRLTQESSNRLLSLFNWRAEMVEPLEDTNLSRESRSLQSQQFNASFGPKFSEVEASFHPDEQLIYIIAVEK